MNVVPTNVTFGGSRVIIQSGSSQEASFIRRYLYTRRIRDSLMPGGLFADPAWDMLLDLYASELENRPVSATAASVAAAVPLTTALRWIRKLSDIGLIDRGKNVSDRRSVTIRLSEKGRAAVAQWVAIALAR